eukprot:340866_1
MLLPYYLQIHRIHEDMKLKCNVWILFICTLHVIYLNLWRAPNVCSLKRVVAVIKQFAIGVQFAPSHVSSGCPSFSTNTRQSIHDKRASFLLCTSHCFMCYL